MVTAHERGRATVLAVHGRRVILSLFALHAFSVTACSLLFSAGDWTHGNSENGNGLEAGPDLDAGPDAPIQPPCLSGDAHACDIALIPAGWHPVRYLDDGSECEQGFQSENVIEPAGNVGCSCDPACTPDAAQCPTPNALDVSYDRVGMCNQSATINPNGDTCHAFSNGPITTAHFEIRPPAQTSVSCSSAPKGTYTGKQARLCTSRNAACNGLLCADQHLCIAADDGGQQACPVNFKATTHQIGSGVQCTGTCMCTGACVDTAFVFTDATCGDLDASAGYPAPLDGMCDPIANGSTKRYSSILLVPTVPSATCTAPTNAPQLSNPRWICCRD